VRGAERALPPQLCASLERLLRPRVSFLVNLLGRRPLSLLLLLLALPLGAQLKALVAVVMGVGMVPRRPALPPACTPRALGDLALRGDSGMRRRRRRARA